ncbi:MAG: LytTR family DNA-binding domain-containing protein, partial [Bacteroidota bacterium]
EKYEKLFPPSPQLFKHLRAAIQRERKYKDRLVIKDRGKIHLQPVNQISLIEAKGDVCRIVRIDGKSLIYSVSLGGLLEQLDPDFFFRINRSQAVRIDHLASIEPYFKNRLTLRVHGHSETITTSSATTADFRNWLEG